MSHCKVSLASLPVQFTRLFGGAYRFPLQLPGGARCAAALDDGRQGTPTLVSLLGRSPDQVDTDRDLVLDGNRQEGGHLDLEVSEGCRNRACDVMRGTFDRLVEEHMGVVSGVARWGERRVGKEGRS